MALNTLIVDDSANIRAFVKRTLGMTGIDLGEIHEAGDGVEALQKLTEHRIDVVLTDINMPNMDGLELVSKIREHHEYDGIRIIVISTEGSREMVLKAVQAGASGYLKKPFGPEEAMEILKEAVAND